MESQRSSIEDNLEFIPERNEYVNSNPDSQEKFSFSEFKVHTNVLDNTLSVADITPEKSFEIGMILKKVGSLPRADSDTEDQTNIFESILPEASNTSQESFNSEAMASRPLDSLLSVSKIDNQMSSRLNRHLYLKDMKKNKRNQLRSLHQTETVTDLFEPESDQTNAKIEESIPQNEEIKSNRRSRGLKTQNSAPKSK